MKRILLLTLLGSLSLAMVSCSGTYQAARPYDDIYYTGDKDNYTDNYQDDQQSATRQKSMANNYNYSAPATKVADNSTKTTATQGDNRNFSAAQQHYDSLSRENLQENVPYDKRSYYDDIDGGNSYSGNYDDYYYTRQLQRFHGADVNIYLDEYDDYDYFNNGYGTTNIYLNGGYDPFYSNYYDPFYYNGGLYVGSSWGWSGFGFGIGYYSPFYRYHNPWRYGYAWGGYPYWGYDPYWYSPYPHYPHHRWISDGGGGNNFNTRGYVYGHYGNSTGVVRGKGYNTRSVNNARNSSVNRGNATTVIPGKSTNGRSTQTGVSTQGRSTATPNTAVKREAPNTRSTGVTRGVVGRNNVSGVTRGTTGRSQGDVRSQRAQERYGRTSATPKYNKPRSYSSPDYRTGRSNTQYNNSRGTNTRTYSNSAPRTNSSYSSPARSNTRSYSSPTRSNSSRSYSTPARSNTRSYSTPARSNSSRSYSTPSRSYSTPARSNSTRSYSPPSSSSSRSYSSPTRSNSSSSYSTPSSTRSSGSSSSSSSSSSGRSTSGRGR